MIDVNGDGRVDIIDAHETPGQWVFYLTLFAHSGDASSSYLQDA